MINMGGPKPEWQQSLGILIYFFGQLALVVGAVYVVFHFVVKYW